MQKSICVSDLPETLLRDQSLQKTLSQHFAKEDNGGAEVLKYHTGTGESAVFLTLKVSIEGRPGRVRIGIRLPISFTRFDLIRLDETYEHNPRDRRAKSER